MIVFIFDDDDEFYRFLFSVIFFSVRKKGRFFYEIDSILENKTKELKLVAVLVSKNKNKNPQQNLHSGVFISFSSSKTKTTNKKTIQ